MRFFFFCIIGYVNEFCIKRIHQPNKLAFKSGNLGNESSSSLCNHSRINIFDIMSCDVENNPQFMWSCMSAISTQYLRVRNTLQINSGTSAQSICIASTEVVDLIYSPEKSRIQFKGKLRINFFILFTKPLTIK